MLYLHCSEKFYEKHDVPFMLYFHSVSEMVLVIENHFVLINDSL